MWESFMSTKFRVRTILSVSLSILFYIMTIYSLFFLKDVFQSLLFLFLFFISFHFFFVEAQKYKNKYFVLIAIVLTIVGSIIIWFDIRQYIASLFVLNLGIIALILSIQWPLNKTLSFNSLNYFTVWWYIFTVFTTITYSLVLIGMYSQFPFNCQNLSQASSNVVDFFTNPFKIWIEKANQIKNDSASFFSANWWSVLSKKTQINWDSKITTIINDSKEQMIGQLFKDNTSVNMWICDYILWQINDRYNKPVFQFSLILLMYLLFYPFLRIIYWLMSIISILLFKSLLWLKVYKIQKVMKEVEEIK